LLSCPDLETFEFHIDGSRWWKAGQQGWFFSIPLLMEIQKATLKSFTIINPDLGLSSNDFSLGEVGHFSRFERLHVNERYLLNGFDYQDRVDNLPTIPSSLKELELYDCSWDNTLMVLKVMADHKKPKDRKDKAFPNLTTISLSYRKPRTTSQKVFGVLSKRVKVCNSVSIAVHTKAM
jgi:hypothetical protein